MQNNVLLTVVRCTRISKLAVVPWTTRDDGRTNCLTHCGSTLREGTGALYPNAGRALLEAGAGLIIFGDTAASKLVVAAVNEANSENKSNRTGKTPGSRVDAAIETLERALEGVVLLAASEPETVSAQGEGTRIHGLMQAAKLLFCNEEPKMEPELEQYSPTPPPSTTQSIPQPTAVSGDLEVDPCEVQPVVDFLAAAIGCETSLSALDPRLGPCRQLEESRRTKGCVGPNSVLSVASPPPMTTSTASPSSTVPAVRSPPPRTAPQSTPPPIQPTPPPSFISPLS